MMFSLRKNAENPGFP